MAFLSIAPFKATKMSKSKKKSLRKSSWKNSAKCAMCSGGRSDLIVPFKPPPLKKLILCKYPHWLFHTGLIGSRSNQNYGFKGWLSLETVKL